MTLEPKLEEILCKGNFPNFGQESTLKCPRLQIQELVGKAIILRTDGSICTFDRRKR